MPRYPTQTQHGLAPTSNDIGIINLTGNKTKEGDRCIEVGIHAEHKENNEWQEHNITRPKTITQHAHVLHTANGHMTLGFPRDMQGTAKLDTATDERLKYDDTLRLGDEFMYLKSIQRLKH